LIVDDPVTPRPAATVMLLRDGESTGLEVLLLRRSSDTPFVPGAHVFPGGAVEAADDDAAFDDHTDLDDATASQLLGVASGGRAYWIAALRECLEEAGVLLAAVDGAQVDDGHSLLRDEPAVRADLERGSVSLLTLCRRHRLQLPLRSMVSFAQWITPEESPRRYDTRFFAAGMPPGQSASADDWEAVEAGWWQPTRALESWQADDIELIEPTVASLRLLADHDDVEAALAALRDVNVRAR
jgi:8-oxo-dGTP pyrophosphatase MutT (NUDIX family)